VTARPDPWARLKARALRVLVWRRDRDAHLRAFAETEAFGARDLAQAASVVRDDWLRRQLLRHAQDEVRHARLLQEGTAPPPTRGLGASVVGETPEAPGVDLEAMGEVRFLAFVHMAEKRAVEEFVLHRAALGEEGARLDTILADERRHVAWTGHALERLRRDGRGAEVDAALRALRRARWTGALLALAQRVSALLGAVTLTGVYLLLLGPFTLGAGRWRAGWIPGTRGPRERAY
jgi:hypothetical protein